MKHLDEAKDLWAELVPKSGQAKTQQGEMLRAVEKLRDEALRNGNMNWDEGHQHFVDYLREHLTAHDGFTDDQKREINADLDAVTEPADLEEEHYDRLADRVVEWTQAQPDLIPHEKIPDLER